MLDKFYTLITALFTAVLTGLRTRVAPTAPRAATFIEYALLAAIAVVIAVLLRSQLRGFFSNILDGLRGF